MTPTVRPPRPEDFPAIVALGEAFDRALTGTGDWSEEDVVHDWRALADSERDAWLVEDGGAVVGFATFQDDGEGTFEADGYVHPDRFGHGIGATIVALTEARAAEQLEVVELPRVVLQNVVLHADEAARALLGGRGYRPVRHFLRMQIDMAGPPPAPVWPDGVTASAFRPDEDAAAIHACVHEAFAEEWSFRAETLADWSRRKLGDPRFDPSLWVVAGEVCGAALCTAGQFDMGFGTRSACGRRGGGAGWGWRSCTRRSPGSGSGASTGRGLGSIPRTRPRPCGSTSGRGCAPCGRLTCTGRSCGPGKRGPPPAAGEQPAHGSMSAGRAAAAHHRGGRHASPIRVVGAQATAGANSSRRSAWAS